MSTTNVPTGDQPITATIDVERLELQEVEVLGHPGDTDVTLEFRGPGVRVRIAGPITPIYQMIIDVDRTLSRFVRPQ